MHRFCKPTVAWHRTWIIYVPILGIPYREGQSLFAFSEVAILRAKIISILFIFVSISNMLDFGSENIILEAAAEEEVEEGK